MDAPRIRRVLVSDVFPTHILTLNKKISQIINSVSVSCLCPYHDLTFLLFLINSNNLNFLLILFSFEIFSIID